MNTRPCIYTDFVGFKTTPEVKDLFLKAQKADKKRLNNALIKVCKYILDNPANNNDTSTNVKEEKPIIVAEKVQVTEEKEVKPVIIVNNATTNTIINKEPTKEELDELVRDIQDDDKEHKSISLREKRNSIKSSSSSSKYPVAFQNREEYFRYLNNVRLKYNTAVPAEKELYLAEKAIIDEILIVDENSEDEE